MKRFLIKTGITLIVLLFVAYGLDWFITRNLHRSDAKMFTTYNTIYNDSLKSNAIIMGSSRGQVQYSPYIIESITGLNCYNISVDGRCIDAEVVLYDIYCQHAPKPKYIIQNIDCGTLQMSNGYEREQYLPYLNDRKLYNLICENEKYTWIDRWFPLIRYAGYREVIKEGIGVKNKMSRPDMYKGYVSYEKEWNGSDFNLIDTIGFDCNPQAVEIFDRYLANCQRDSIKVILVYAPFYIGATEKMGSAVDSMFSFYQSFANRYGCEILNYTYDSLCYDTANFYNAGHLNRKGAEMFSTKLAYDLKELLK